MNFPGAFIASKKLSVVYMRARRDSAVALSSFAVSAAKYKSNVRRQNRMANQSIDHLLSLCVGFAWYFLACHSVRL